MGSQSASAVTDREMEEARTITAITYLRYANDASGYLDEHHPKTMSELKNILKEKEKENLKAFNAVPVPKDYASWDKEKLVAYWSGTFFNSPGLSAKGKIGKSRVRGRLNNMQVAAPAPEKPVEAAPAPVKPDSVAPAEAPAEPASAVNPVNETPKTQEEVDSLLALSEADAGLDPESREKRSSGTWYYVVILIILVIAVIALVVFASKILKKSAEESANVPAERTNGRSLAERAENADMREKFSATLAQKNEEIRRLNRELEAAREESSSLRAQLDKAGREIAPVSAPLSAPAVSDARCIYLGRVNNRGLFVRADRRLNHEASVYRLDTEDGVSGSFRVLTEPDIDDRLLADPVHWLGGGCLATDLEDTDGYSEVRTLSSGTAIFQDGAWKVIRKANIRYE